MPAEQRVAHRATDEVEGVTGGGEPLAEGLQHGREPVELGGHGLLGRREVPAVGGRGGGRLGHGGQL